MKTLIAMLAVALPAAALAHGHLESSTPAKGSTLQKSPDNVMLEFNEAVDLTSLTLQKKGEKAARALGPLPDQDSEHLTVPLPKLADGDYVLSFVAASSDLHEARGTIPFRISSSAKPEAANAAGKGADCCRNMDHDHMHQGGQGSSPAPAGAAAGHDHEHAAPATK